MGQPWLNIVKAFCSLVVAVMYAPFAYFGLSFFLCNECLMGRANAAGLHVVGMVCQLAMPFLAWLGPATIIFLVLVEVDKPSSWGFLRPLANRATRFKPGSLTSYGAIVVALLAILGFIFGCAYLSFPLGWGAHSSHSQALDPIHSAL